MPLSLECVSYIDLYLECLLLYQYFIYAQQLENSLFVTIVTTGIMLEKHFANSVKVFVRFGKKHR